MYPPSQRWRTCVPILLAQALGAAESSHPYAITGYWLFGRGSAEEWREVLTKIHDLGADTVVQFGPRLRRVSVDDLHRQKAFSGGRPGGRALVESARADVEAVGGTGKLRHVYTYACSEDFGDALAVRPRVDTRVVVGGRVFWRLVLPASEPGDRKRDLRDEREYDLVLIAGRQRDSVEMLLDEAGKLGMQVFAGMPAAPAHPKYPWDPWRAAMPIFLELAKRVFEDYAQRFAACRSFAGVYQSLEMPVAERTLNAVLGCYRAQHALVRQALPGKQILVSPYWDARKKRPTGVTPASVREGIKLIARCDVDIIAPQDSRGTGKVGLFWPHQMDEPVDPRLAPVTGVRGLTYGDAYHASTRELFRMARLGLDELAEQEGIKVDLWANIEAFEPGKGIPCGVFTTSQRTTKERLDRAIMSAGPYPSKLISYMWDSYYTCRAGRAAPLGDEIAEDCRRPIVVEALRSQRNRRSGLMVQGYNIADGEAEVVVQEETIARVSATEGRANADLGRDNVRYPDRLQVVWVPLPEHSGRLAVTVRGPGGRCHHPFAVSK